MKRLVLFSAFFFLTSTFSFAGSATWRPHPIGGDWNTAANWRPRTVPNGPADIATFGASDTTDVALTTQIEVDGVVFNPGASAFTVTATYPGTLVFSGAGITNNSGVTQTFVGDGYSPEGLVFRNQANAGVQTVLTTRFPVPSVLAFYDESSAGNAMLLIPGNDDDWDAAPQLHFFQNATADHSTIILTGGAGFHADGAAASFYDASTADNANIRVTAATDGYAYEGGSLHFYDTSTAANSVITNEGSAIVEDGGVTHFHDDATASNAIITADGATIPDAGPGEISFYESSNAENATLIGNGGTNGGRGGTIQFWDTSDGGTARVELFGNGTLDLSGLPEFAYIFIGSLEGDGIVSRGSETLFLTVGRNNLSTVFSGVIQGGCEVNKVGSGTLTLSGANTYTGYTTVYGGFLRVENRTGSATGSGVVIVSNSTLGGSGIVGGSVSLYAGGVLAPGSGASTLNIKRKLAFLAGASYTWRVRTASAQADKVVVGVQVKQRPITIATGDQFLGIAIGNATLPPGTIFTAIENASSYPINGTFGNLPEGGTIRIGNNTFQANYEGGDGNDLTLTVVP